MCYEEWFDVVSYICIYICRDDDYWVYNLLIFSTNNMVCDDFIFTYCVRPF